METDASATLVAAGQAAASNGETPFPAPSKVAPFTAGASSQPKARYRFSIDRPDGTLWFWRIITLEL